MRSRTGHVRALRIHEIDHLVQLSIGVLRASMDEAEHLLTNAWIVSLYRIDYLRFTSGTGGVA